MIFRTFEESSGEKIPLNTWFYTQRFDILFLMEVVKTRVIPFKTGITLKEFFGRNVKVHFNRL